MSGRGQGSRGEAAGGDSWIRGYPVLAAQWHPEKNGDLRPGGLTHGSGRKVWWKCAAGPDHEWEASPNNRTSGKSGCPFCAGRAVSVTNNLARHPEVARQWHPTMNGKLTPEGVVAGSSLPVWWRCPVSPEHEWRAAPHDRIAGKGGCPFCLGMRVAPGTSLARTAPRLAAEWHPSKNGRLTPGDVTSSATRSVWWLCSRDGAHEWRASVLRRSSGHGCPACAEQGVRECQTEDAPARPYVLVLEPDRDRRVSLVLFMRSRDIDALGARDAVEAEHQAKGRGVPCVIVTARDGEASPFPDVPRRVVPAIALGAWLTDGGASSEPGAADLMAVELFVREEIRRARR